MRRKTGDKVSSLIFNRPKKASSFDLKTFKTRCFNGLCVSAAFGFVSCTRPAFVRANTFGLNSRDFGNASLAAAAATHHLVRVIAPYRPPIRQLFISTRQVNPPMQRIATARPLARYDMSITRNQPVVEHIFIQQPYIEPFNMPALDQGAQVDIQILQEVRQNVHDLEVVANARGTLYNRWAAKCAKEYLYLLENQNLRPRS